jgi:hypothetical protein
MTTGTFATAAVATGAGGLEIVIYKPISKIGGASVFAVNPARYPSIATVAEEFAWLWDDDSIIFWDDDSQILDDE